MNRSRALPVKVVNKKKPKVSKGVKDYVKRAINIEDETKYIDVAVNVTASSAAFGFVELTGAIAQGTSRSNRIGAKIRVLGMRYMMRGESGDDVNEVRILILGRKPGGSISTASALSSLTGPVNTDTFHSYRDIWAELHYIGLFAGNIYQRKYWRGYIPVNRTLNYGTGSNTVTNSLGIQFHSDSAIVPNPGLVGNVRIYFKDA